MKIHQCHNCNTVLGTELISCPNCESGMKEAFQLFELTRGLTKEESERYEKSVLELFKPTGRNRFEGGQRMKKETTLQDVLDFTKTMKESMAEDVFKITNERDLAFNLGALEAIEAVEIFIRHGLPKFEEDSE